MKLELIDWAGLEEATELGSPYIARYADGYAVYRLLRWAESNILKEKARIRSAKSQKKHLIAVSPEIKKAQEDEMIDSVIQINTLNKRLEDRDEHVGRVINRIRCGVTIPELSKIIGEPDRFEPYEYSYYWGTYKVTAYGTDRPITYVTKGNGDGEMRKVCAR